LLFNKRYNLCYGLFLKQLKTKPKVHLVKHPSVIKKVNYRGLVEELWKTHISDDPEEDQVLKEDHCQLQLWDAGEAVQPNAEK
jgi:hypothetical protein